MKAVSNKLLGSAPPPSKILKIGLHLVASGSIENDLNVKINNTLQKLDIVILKV